MTKPKPHWTQTPKGRKYMARLSKLGWEKKPSRMSHRNTNSKPAIRYAKDTVPKPLVVRPKKAAALDFAQFTHEDIAAAEVFGYVNAILEERGRRTGIPVAVLAERLGRLLQSHKGR